MDRARLAWASRLGVPPDTFAHPGIVIVERAELDSVVSIAFSDACVVLTPPRMVEPVGRLALDTLTDAAALTRALAPDARCVPIGTAELWFTDISPATGCAATRVATEPDLVALRTDCTKQEWDEAGLDDMPWRWAGHTDSGATAAVAGYEQWGELAQLGVLAVPAHRGRGFAHATAARTVTEAIGTGRLAQWRCRVGNDASARLAHRLGFVRAGVQAAVSVNPDG